MGPLTARQGVLHRGVYLDIITFLISTSQTLNDKKKPAKPEKLSNCWINKGQQIPLLQPMLPWTLPEVSLLT